MGPSERARGLKKPREHCLHLPLLRGQYEEFSLQVCRRGGSIDTDHRWPRSFVLQTSASLSQASTAG